MKKILLFLVLAIGINAQAVVIKYTYDNAGNRTKRAVDQNARYSQQNISQNDTSIMLCDKKIGIFPNPTDGPIKIEVSFLGANDKGEIFIYDISGQLVLTKKIEGMITNIDLSARPSGMYVMNIRINQEENTWKIIKK